MASDFIQCLAVRELILGDVSAARLNNKWGMIGVSAGKLVWYNGTAWKTITDA